MRLAAKAKRIHERPCLRRRRRQGESFFAKKTALTPRRARNAAWSNPAGFVVPRGRASSPFRTISSP
ncbi:MAG: hypothetical protein A3D28_04770 [Omnitrophica bacterium RIFCSPHIGHO2_02_FULL_63_14]|nr:MAG: hypothetical protein A3D28_04770 [Omnitrophica bacterium RIFCSPHIGHO2_02_FULL_63_14]